LDSQLHAVIHTDAVGRALEDVLRSQNNAAEAQESLGALGEFLLTDLFTDRGNSGGGHFNSDGQLIGNLRGRHRKSPIFGHIEPDFFVFPFASLLDYEEYQAVAFVRLPVCIVDVTQ
jgi:hypothetical protein